MVKVPSRAKDKQLMEVTKQKVTTETTGKNSRPKSRPGQAKRRCVGDKTEVKQLYFTEFVMGSNKANVQNIQTII